VVDFLGNWYQRISFLRDRYVKLCSFIGNACREDQEKENQQTQSSRAETKRLQGDQITRQERPNSEEPRNEKTEDSGQRAEQL
jgi:hypothetical protein